MTRLKSLQGRERLSLENGCRLHVVSIEGRNVQSEPPVPRRKRVSAVQGAAVAWSDLLLPVPF